MKTIGIVLSLALAGLFGWQVYRRIAAPPGGGKPPAAAVPVEVARVQQGTIRHRGEFSGSLESRSRFTVAPKISGRLERLFVNVGDRVERNQPIAALDDEEHAQQVESARAELEVARANVAETESGREAARREFERAKTLRQKQIASESELDEGEALFKASEAKHKVALAKVEQAKATLEAAQVRLSYTRIEASWEDGDDGPRFVGERFVDEGTMLRANDPIVSVVDIATLKAIIFATERDYPSLRSGQAVELGTDAFPGKRFPGAIARIAPILRESSRQARVEIEVPNPDLLLKPGMFIRASIEFAAHENATVLPYAALVRRNGDHGAFVADLERERASFVPLVTGIADEELLEIIDPPPALAGAWVVTLGQHLLEDDARISIPPSTTGGPPAQGPP